MELYFCGANCRLHRRRISPWKERKYLAEICHSSGRRELEINREKRYTVNLKFTYQLARLKR